MLSDQPLIDWLASQMGHSSKVSTPQRHNATVINNKIAFLAIAVAVLIVSSGRCRSLSHGIVPQEPWRQKLSRTLEDCQ